jgi:hypothetical protein
VWYRFVIHKHKSIHRKLQHKRRKEGNRQDDDVDASDENEDDGGVVDDSVEDVVEDAVEDVVENEYQTDEGDAMSIDDEPLEVDLSESMTQVDYESPAISGPLPYRNGIISRFLPSDSH